MGLSGKSRFVKQENLKPVIIFEYDDEAIHPNYGATPNEGLIMNADEKKRWDKCKHDCTTPFIHGTDNKDYGKPACDTNCPDYEENDHAQGE